MKKFIALLLFFFLPANLSAAGSVTYADLIRFLEKAQKADSRKGRTIKNADIRNFVGVGDASAVDVNWRNPSTRSFIRNNTKILVIGGEDSTIYGLYFFRKSPAGKWTYFHYMQICEKGKWPEIQFLDNGSLFSVELYYVSHGPGFLERRREIYKIKNANVEKVLEIPGYCCCFYPGAPVRFTMEPVLSYADGKLMADYRFFLAPNDDIDNIHTGKEHLAYKFRPFVTWRRIMFTRENDHFVFEMSSSQISLEDLEKFSETDYDRIRSYFSLK